MKVFAHLMTSYTQLKITEGKTEWEREWKVDWTGARLSGDLEIFLARCLVCTASERLSIRWRVRGRSLWWAVECCWVLFPGECRRMGNTKWSLAPPSREGDFGQSQGPMNAPWEIHLPSAGAPPRLTTGKKIDSGGSFSSFQLFIFLLCNRKMQIFNRFSTSIFFFCVLLKMMMKKRGKPSWKNPGRCFLRNEKMRGRKWSSSNVLYLLLCTREWRTSFGTLQSSRGLSQQHSSSGSVRARTKCCFNLGRVITEKEGLPGNL